MPSATDGFVLNGAYTYAGNSTVYATQTFDKTIRTIGVKIKRRSLHVGATSSTTGALIISANDNFVSDMLHFTFNLGVWELQIRQDGGDFDTILSGSFSPSLSLDTEYTFQVQVDDIGTTAVVTVPGSDPQAVSDSRIASVIGKYAVWEEFPNDDESNLVDVLDYHEVWAYERGI